MSKYAHIATHSIIYKILIQLQLKITTQTSKKNLKDPTFPLPQWDVCSELPSEIKPNWLIPDVEPPARYCVVGGWDNFIFQEFISQARPGGNHGWRSQAEIESLIQRLTIHTKYQNQKSNEIKERGGKRYKKIPEWLQGMKAESEEIGAVTKKWCLLHLEDGTVKLRKKVIKDNEVSYIDMEAIEESYELLADIHISLGHCAGMVLFKHVKEKGLYDFPREMVTKFPMYCVTCRKNYVQGQLKKLFKNQKNKLFKKERKTKVTPSVPRSIVPNKKVSIV